MSTVRQAVEYLRALVDSVQPVELPGRRFRFVPALNLEDGELAAQDRDFTIEPRDITGLGTPLGQRCLAARVQLAVVVHYRLSLDRLEDATRITQDAAQLSTALYESPQPSSAPWYSVDYGGASIVYFDDCARLTLLLSPLQRVTS